MYSLNVPPAGLVLEATPSTNNSSSKSVDKPAQVLQLNLASGLLEDLLRDTRAGGKGVQITLGKSPVGILAIGNKSVANVVLHSQALHFGNKSHKMATTAQILRTDLYRLSQDKRDKLTMVGKLSHKVEMRKQENAAAEVDPAILQLQNSLAEAKRVKESNT